MSQTLDPFLPQDRNVIFEQPPSRKMKNIFNVSAPRPILTKLLSRRKEYTESLPLRVAVGTYNINGGKHFRSIVYKDVSLSDWLLDAHKSEKIHGAYES